MTNPTPKQLVIRSLRALHKTRIGKQFRIKALNDRRRELAVERQDVIEEQAKLDHDVQILRQKIDWEIERNGSLLSGPN